MGSGDLRTFSSLLRALGELGARKNERKTPQPRQSPFPPVEKPAEGPPLGGRHGMKPILPEKPGGVGVRERAPGWPHIDEAWVNA